jgi:hypothetical protein
MTETPIPQLVPIPGSIVMAIAAVMANLEAVQKSQENKHGNYKFASTDDIYAAITRKMGEVGLICLPLEEGIEITPSKNADGKTVNWMRVSYLFALATKEATWTDSRCRRTLIIQITGPQTFQAAQSYAEKTFLRGLFKIATGDVDLDSMPEGYEYSPIKFNAVAPPPPLAESEPASAPDAAVPVAATVDGLAAIPAPGDQPEPETVADAPSEDAIQLAAVSCASAMTKANTIERLNQLMGKFNEKFDGHISKKIANELEIVYENAFDRITGAGAG